MGERYGFKTSFRGFSRQDVLNYIDELRLTLHEEQEEHREETEALRAELAEAQKLLADAPQAAQREEELRAALDDANATIGALRQQAETLTADLKAAEEQINSGREQELNDAIAELRTEVQLLRERETALNAQLAETHQAVATLWQEKEAAERKLTAALEYADRQQQAALEFKQQLGSEVAPAEESAAGKPMERWLF